MMDPDGELSFEDLTFGEDSEKNKQVESEKSDPNAIFVYTTYGGKINVPALLKIVEDKCGEMKQNNFREKQCFGFIQFEKPESAEKALQALNNLDLEGFPINAERCVKITPGRDPRTHELDSEFKNSTLVFKNLPFQLKQEKLEEMLNALENKPQSVSYLYDANGMFRGMAFVKYKEIEHSAKAFEAMNNLDINGRKLRIEYKRKVQEAEVDDNVTKLFDQLNTFKTSSALAELAFPCGSSYQRKQIHQFAEKLGLVHFSTGEGENRFVLVKKKEGLELPTPSPPVITTTAPNVPISASPSKGQPIQFNKGRKAEYRQKQSYEEKMSPVERGFVPVGSPSQPIVSRSFGSGSLGAQQFNLNQIKSPPSSFGTSPYKNSALVLNRSLFEISISPVRQPKGPDGTTGFGDAYRKARTKEKS